jgi:hypothetical protein
MTISLSSALMDAMGFREEVAAGAITASFMSVTVYEVRGVVMPAGFVSASLARVAGTEYRIALSQSVNDGCRALIGDAFEESESTWCETVKTKGPFALIAVGPTDFMECTAGRVNRNASGAVTTYDGFPGLRDTLRGLEQRVLPPVYSALTCALNANDRYVSVRHLARASTGRCPDGTQVHDLRLEMNADMYVSRALEASSLIESIASVAARAPKLNQRAAKFFWLGAGESDHVKRFLYFFLALEVHTHAVFTRLDHEDKVADLLSEANGLLPNAIVLLRSQVASLTNLFDRFVWCTGCAWPHLTEEDVALFKELKDARDAIAHGRASEPPAGFPRSAQLLAHKVLWH